MKNFLISCILCVILSGCYNLPDSMKMYSWVFKQMPQDAPASYKRGWRDGCESGLSSMTNTTFKTFYSFKQDKSMRSDPLYYKTWKDTYTFCRHYAYGTIREGDQRMQLPNNRSRFFTSFLGAENILDHGTLNMWGPGGTTLMFFNNFGSVGGDLGDNLGMQGELDFSGDGVLNGSHEAGTWDFSY